MEKAKPGWDLSLEFICEDLAERQSETQLRRALFQTTVDPGPTQGRTSGTIDIVGLHKLIRRPIRFSRPGN